MRTCFGESHGEDGVGVVIVNNDVTRDLWVVEPHISKLEYIDEAEGNFS